MAVREKATVEGNRSEKDGSVAQRVSGLLQQERRALAMVWR